MARANFWMQFGNQMTAWLLRSPLHGWLSKQFVLITVTGRKTGNAITTPVNYIRRDNRLTITSLPARTWWRNVRGGNQVALVLQGRAARGWANVIEDEPGVTTALAEYLSQVPNVAKYFAVALDANGVPNRADVARVARKYVIVQVDLEHG
jgi:hypothetical protein